MQKLVFLWALLIPTFFLVQIEIAEAKTTCRSIGLVWSSAQKRCVGGGKKRPRYERKGNKYCRDSRPAAQNMAGLRASNSRAPYMRPQVYQYLQNLKKQCRGLVVESTFRSCDANRNAGGVQRSKHLCGAAADTSGCPGAKSKEMAAAVCAQSGMTFVNEGPRRFPHCQMSIDCN